MTLEGLEYFFQVDDGSNQVSSDTVLIVFLYDENNAPTIPALSSGGQPNNWRMFSIPFILDDKKVSSLFSTGHVRDPTPRKASCASRQHR